MKEKILLASPHMSSEGYELEYVNQAFETNWVAPLGPNVDNFEKEIAKHVGAGHAAALVTGTSAIHLALKAVGVKDGDIVLCQSLTFSASANPIIYERAIPVFIDSDEDSWNMSPKHLEEALKKYPNTKAVIVVHLYGLPAKLDEIVDICKRYGAALIEDAAESLGTTYKGKHTGTFGDYGIFSFNGNKIITTSGGGMLVSEDEEGIKKARFWATQARDKARHYQHSDIGFNYRMSNVVAGVGRGQLKVLDKRVEKKREIYSTYKEAFKDIKEIQMMPLNDFGFSNCWLSSMTVAGEVTPLDIIVALENENIEARPLWKPMHQQPFFEKYDYFGSGASDKLFKTGLCLPSDTKMTKDQQQHVIDVVRSLF